MSKKASKPVETAANTSAACVPPSSKSPKTIVSTTIAAVKKVAPTRIRSKPRSTKLEASRNDAPQTAMAAIPRSRWSMKLMTNRKLRDVRLVMRRASSDPDAYSFGSP